MFLNSKWFLSCIVADISMLLIEVIFHVIMFEHISAISQFGRYNALLFQKLFVGVWTELHLIK